MVESKKGAYTPTTQAIITSLTKHDPAVSEALKNVFFNDVPSKVAKWHALFADPLFYPKQNMSLDEMRAIAYKRLKKVADAKLFSIYDFVNDPKNLLTAHEMLSLCDGALATKFTV